MCGKYFVWEGGDASSKSTQSLRAFEYYKQLGKQVIHTRNPGATPLGQKLRNIIKHDLEIKLDPLTERFLFLADNSCFINSILKPSLEKNTIVIADRSNFISDLIYGPAVGIDFDKILQLHALVEAPKIDVLLIYWCDIATVLKRIENRNKHNEVHCKIEGRGLEFICNVNKQYFNFMNHDSELYQTALKYAKHIQFVDTSGTIDEVWTETLKYL